MRLCAFAAKGLGSIPGQGTKIPQALQGVTRVVLMTMVMMVKITIVTVLVMAIMVM